MQAHNPGARCRCWRTDEVVVTHEDIDRAHDRARVSVGGARWDGCARGRALLWLLIGPGILVMLGENDGPSMLSYAATGAKFGIGFFLPFIVLTFVMALVVQEMTVRLGAATHRGHAELIFERFGPFWGWFSMIDLSIGNFLTLVTEFIAIRAGLGFFGVPPWAAVLVALVVLVFALMSHRYWTWERMTLAAAAFNLIFVPVALLAHPHWGAMGHALLTWTPLPAARTGHFADPALRHRRHGDAVDAFLPAERDRGQGTDDEGHSIRAHRYGAGRGAGGGWRRSARLSRRRRCSGHIERGEFRGGAVCAGAGAVRSGTFGAALFALGIFEAGHRGGDHHLHVLGLCVWRGDAAGRTA